MSKSLKNLSVVASSASVVASSASTDPLHHTPILKFFAFFVAGFAITPPTSWLWNVVWRWRIPVWFILFGSVVSAVALFGTGSFLSIIIPSLLINYSLAPSTLPVLRGIAPLWVTMYRPDATRLYRDFKNRVTFFLNVFLVACSFLLLIALGVWMYYLYFYVFMAPPSTTALSLLSSIMFGFYAMYCMLGIMLTVLVQVVVSIVHELQLELLLRAIRQRTRDHQLLTIVPSIQGRPSLIARFLFLCARDPIPVEVRQNPGTHSPLEETADPPLSTIFDMIKNAQDTMDWTSYKVFPLFAVNNYTLILLDLLFFALSFYQVFFGIIYMGAVVGAIPLGLFCHAVLNRACENFQIRLECSLSMYTPEEQAQILAYIRLRPLTYKLGGLHITYSKIALVTHALLIPPLISFFLWFNSGRPFL